MTFLLLQFKHREVAQSRKGSASDDISFDSTLVSSYVDMDPFDVYERGSMAGCIALRGVCVSIVFSFICIFFGIYISLYRHTIDEVLSPSFRNLPFRTLHAEFAGVIAVLPAINSGKTEFLSLTLNLVVTVCTESIGFVHSVALKSALACEYRLDRNTNLRLLTAARGDRFTNPNGTICNIIMAILLIMSYVFSSLVFIPVQSDAVSPQKWWNTCIFAPPVLMLGIVLLLQAMIAVAGISQTRILTWSSSPLDTTAALLHDGRVFRRSGRCMHNVLHSTTYPGPRRPSNFQPSAWQSHPSIKKIVIILWCLVFACGMWSVIITAVWYKLFATIEHNPPSFSIFPNEATRAVGYENDVDPDHGCPPLAWLVVFIIFIVAQGALTLGLHCSEVIANVVRDETMWRVASMAGIKPSKNPLMVVLGSWPNIGLLVAKPVLHWMFGLSIAAMGTANPLGTTLLSMTVSMRYVQTFYLTFGLFVFALALTFVARRCPPGPQPAAYGHIQTLANLVDEWSPTMWWGHKEEGKLISHAGATNFIVTTGILLTPVCVGTAAVPLSPVRINGWYAGL